MISIEDLIKDVKGGKNQQERSGLGGKPEARGSEGIGYHGLHGDDAGVSDDRALDSSSHGILSSQQLSGQRRFHPPYLMLRSYHVTQKLIDDGHTCGADGNAGSKVCRHFGNLNGNNDKSVLSVWMKAMEVMVSVRLICLYGKRVSWNYSLLWKRFCGCGRRGRRTRKTVE